MKKNLAKTLMMLFLVMLLPMTVYAQTEEEFVLTCSTKTSAEAEIFNVESDEENQASVYSVVGNIGAETYVRCTGNEDDEAGYVECIVYADGSLQKVWIKADVLMPAWTLIYFQDGGYVKLHDRIANDPQALSDYCNTYFPGREYSLDEMAEAFVCDAIVSQEWMASQFGEESMALSVKLVTLGLNSSVVATPGGEMVVPTQHLSFGSNVEGEHRVGVVYAPRTGEASLRKTAAGNGEVIRVCKTGRIVAVLDYGSTYSKIRYDGEEGYIRTDCLVFPEGTEEIAGVGILHLNDKADGEDAITVRCTASTSTAKVTTWLTGTSVTVYGKQGNWYAIENDGWFGYVQQQYLTMEAE